MPRMKKTVGRTAKGGSFGSLTQSRTGVRRPGKSASARGYAPPGGGGGRMSSPVQRRRAPTKGRTAGGGMTLRGY